MVYKHQHESTAIHLTAIIGVGAVRRVKQGRGGAGVYRAGQGQGVGGGGWAAAA